MATSITDPKLVYASDKAIVTGGVALSRAKFFTTDFSAEAIQPGTTMKVPEFTGKVSTFDINTNDYSNTDGTVTYPSITFDKHFKSTFQINDALDAVQVPLGGFWEKCGVAAGEAIARGVDQAIATEIATLTNGTVVGTFDTLKNVGKIRSAIAKIKNPANCVLVLTPADYTDLLALLTYNQYGEADPIKNGYIAGFMGFKAVVMNSFATESYAVEDNALLIASRVIPVLNPSMYSDVGTVTDDNTGFTIGVRKFGVPAKGSNFLSLEVLFGVGSPITDGSKMEYIWKISAT